VSQQRVRYSEVTTELATGDHGIGADATALVREMGLAEEQRSIEGSVTSAMAYAADTINNAATAASRYQYSAGHSLWSRIGDFLSGVGDGIYDGAKSLLALAIEAAKLSPERMLVDPEGYFHDLEHLVQTVAKTGEVIYNDPMAFLKDMAMYDEFRKDPVHWVGAIIPGIVVGIFTDGVGDAGEAADLAATTDEGVAESGAISSDIIPPDSIDHILYGEVKNGKAQGFHSAPGGEVPSGRALQTTLFKDPNGVYQAKIWIKDDEGVLVPKPVLHTMFPDAWDHQTVIKAIEDSFSDGQKIVNGEPVGPTGLTGSYKWEGMYDGITIQGYVKNGRIMTAFPIPNFGD
jgi:hypothetical protein